MDAVCAAVCRAVERLLCSLCGTYNRIMGKKSRVDEPALDTLWDCHKEISRCTMEISKIEQQHAEWIANNPGGSWPGTVAMISRLQARKRAAQAKFDELNVTGT